MYTSARFVFFNTLALAFQRLRHAVAFFHMAPRADVAIFDAKSGVELMSVKAQDDEFLGASVDEGPARSKDDGALVATFSPSA